ncbi:hypothetical protein J5N97_024328 [Dioscorea zingiberensis]|uniref:Vacuolar ATPase assembly protein VMA22 n=1 Tax=Dioscorea zingiberensis TaxID=325984 RepID=A0A9D5H8N0_9LILI|nr:hypothetical protein J5N97_024328 [Dioscorea zingiberensis]
MEESIQTIDNGGGEEEEIATLRFLDSLDAYVSLLNSLSSTLRQGWLELASARHSMGSSRISSALFDLKVQSASTTCQVTDSSDGSPSDSPHFTLSKWVSSRRREMFWGRTYTIAKESSSSKLRRRGAPNSSDGVDDANSAINDSHSTVGNIIQKEKI